MKRGQNGKGFTIVEILIVIGVIVVLAGMAAMVYRGAQEKAKAAAARTEQAEMVEKIETHIVSDLYPGSISDCPTPAAANLCIQPMAGQVLNYFAFTPTTAPRFSAALHSATPAYELMVRNTDGFYYSSTAEITSGNEFVQYMDMAPLIDQYGLRKYKISFDIKSASTANQSTVNVYMQNGSGARYGFSVSVPVTTSYDRQSIVITPTGPNASFTQSVLAFYGTYGTGNRPTIKNVEIGPAW